MEDSVDLVPITVDKVLNAMEHTEKLIEILRKEFNTSPESLEEFITFLGLAKALEVQLKMDIALGMSKDAERKEWLTRSSVPLFSLIESTACNIMSSVIDEKDKEIFLEMFPRWFPAVFSIPYDDETPSGEELVKAVTEFKDNIEKARESMKP